MARMWRTVSVVLIVGALLTSTALAHHGWTQYDETKTLNLNGAITEASYSNPHASIRVRVEGENSGTWLAVLAPPSRMTSRGLSADSLKVRTTVTVVGYPHRKQQDEMRAERITIGDKTVELR